MPRGTGKYDEAKRQNRLWSPRLIAGQAVLNTWHDAMDTGSFDIVSGVVSNWRPQNPGGVTFTQGTAGNRPAFSQSGLNGRPCLDWPAAPQDWLRVANVLSIPITMLAVINPGGVGDHRYMDGTGNKRFQARSRTNLTEIMGDSSNTIQCTNITNSVGNVVGGIFNNAASRATLNGVHTTGTAGDGTSAHTFTAIGGDGVGGGSWNGTIGEIIIFKSSLPLYQLALMEGYLAWKWRLQDYLVAGHNFRNRPPLIGD